MSKLGQGYLPGLIAGLVIGVVVFLGVIKVAAIW